MKKSWIKGHYGTFQDAFNAIGSRFKKSRMFSIQCSAEAKDYPWVLIYYLGEVDLSKNDMKV